MSLKDIFSSQKFIPGYKNALTFIQAATSLSQIHQFKVKSLLLEILFHLVSELIENFSIFS